MGHCFSSSVFLPHFLPHRMMAAIAIQHAVGILSGMIRPSALCASENAVDGVISHQRVAGLNVLR